jgi:hypothetical protein
LDEWLFRSSFRHLCPIFPKRGAFLLKILNFSSEKVDFDSKPCIFVV